MRNQVEIKIEGMSDGPLLHSLSLARNLLFQKLNQIRSKYLYSSLLSSISATLIRTNIKTYLNGNIFLNKNSQPWQEMTLSFEFPPRPRWVGEQRTREGQEGQRGPHPGGIDTNNSHTSHLAPHILGGGGGGATSGGLIMDDGSDCTALLWRLFKLAKLKQEKMVM